MQALLQILQKGTGVHVRTIVGHRKHKNSNTRHSHAHQAVYSRTASPRCPQVTTGPRAHIHTYAGEHCFEKTSDGLEKSRLNGIDRNNFVWHLHIKSSGEYATTLDLDRPGFSDPAVWYAVRGNTVANPMAAINSTRLF